MNITGIEIFENITKDFPSNSQKNKLWSSVFASDPRLTTRDIFMMMSYTIIVLVSIFGNLLVCSIVARNPSLRGSTYVFIANLALSDLLMTILNIPFNVARLLLNNWPFGAFICSFVPLMQVTFVYVSTFTMTCIATDRYRIISKPLRPRLTTVQAIMIIICIWLLAVVLSLPHAIFNEVVESFTYRPLIRCRTVYPDNMSHWITLFTVLTQYVLPLSLAGVLYCLIVAKVWARNVLGVVTEAQLISQARAKRKVNNQDADPCRYTVRLVLVASECLSLAQRIQRDPVFLQIFDAHHDFLRLPLAGDEFGVLQPFRLLLFERALQIRCCKLLSLLAEYWQKNASPGLKTTGRCRFVLMALEVSTSWVWVANIAATVAAKIDLWREVLPSLVLEDQLYVFQRRIVVD
ncbi:probable G-protein coupled receptor 83 [Caerostris darwini]|uniref:Probable G-protein coupled receptor 83 n=1 Tax=Caerostris darwini TaxID=1538125 RepID=A0AAV4TBQ9_9ARAC|nr:probable G-protein coupled receptor 83 [Caerostris darwini]